MPDENTQSSSSSSPSNTSEQPPAQSPDTDQQSTNPPAEQNQSTTDDTQDNPPEDQTPATDAGSTPVVTPEPGCPDAGAGPGQVAPQDSNPDDDAGAGVGGIDVPPILGGCCDAGIQQQPGPEDAGPEPPPGPDAGVDIPPSPDGGAGPTSSDYNRGYCFGLNPGFKAGEADYPNKGQTPVPVVTQDDYGQGFLSGWEDAYNWGYGYASWSAALANALAKGTDSGLIRANTQGLGRQLETTWDAWQSCGCAGYIDPNNVALGPVMPAGDIQLPGGYTPPEDDNDTSGESASNQSGVSDGVTASRAELGAGEASFATTQYAQVADEAQAQSNAKAVSTAKQGAQQSACEAQDEATKADDASASASAAGAANADDVATSASEADCSAKEAQDSANA